MPKKLPFDLNTIKEIEEKYGTPFFLYDENIIRERAKKLKDAFANKFDFKEFFAIKATPNPSIMKIMKEEGFGVDAATMTELLLCDKCDIYGDDIMFSSNGTSNEDFKKALELNSIINLDDISLIDRVIESSDNIPELLCFRINPGNLQTGNSIIGSPMDAKFGITLEQVIPAYKKAKKLGIKKFGIHTMVGSNVLNEYYFLDTVNILIDILNKLKKELDIEVEFINIGGGFGIPYRLDETELDIEHVSELILELYNKKLDYKPKLFMEHGRWLTGPSGFLISKVVAKKDTYKNYKIIDASMSDLMRPGLYRAYHYITILREGKMIDENTPKEIVDVVGSLCENNDKFAIDRELPKINIDDYLIIHDVGAHGRAMGFNYNGKLRSPEILLKKDGSLKLIQGRETFEDYTRNMIF